MTAYNLKTDNQASERQKKLSLLAYLVENIDNITHISAQECCNSRKNIHTYNAPQYESEGNLTPPDYLEGGFSGEGSLENGF